MKTYGEKNADWIKPNVWLVNRGGQRKQSRFDKLLQQIRDHPEMSDDERQAMITRLMRVKN